MEVHGRLWALYMFKLPTFFASGFARTKKYIIAHKVTSVIVLVAVLGAGYWEYGRLTNTSGETRYVVAQAQLGTIIVSVTGTGQVSASNQLDVKPKVSGEIIAVPVQNGQFIKAGTLIAEIDPAQAQKSVRDAEANLQSAQFSLQKLQEPADTVSLTQAQNNAENAKNTLSNAYDTAFNEISGAFLDLPTVITGLNTVLFNYDRTLGGGSQQNIDYYTNAITQYDTLGRATQYHDDALTRYNAAKSIYDTVFAEYKATNRTADIATIEKLLNDSYKMTQSISDAAKSANNLIQLYQDIYTSKALTPNPTSSTQISSLGNYTATVNSHLTSLSSSINSLVADKQNVVETGQSLEKLQRGADPLDVQSTQLTVTQRQNALKDAQDNLADYYVRAPFDGTIATLGAKLHDTAGSSALATIITQGKIAQLSLNEVDAAKVKVDDKATLTFDAVPDLTIVGQVSEIDTVGTVSQGVVTYAVKISFGTQDARIKPGMSVAAAIQTNVKQNVLLVPGSSVRSSGTGQNASNYVEVFNPPLSGDTSTSAGGGSSSGGQGIASTRTPTQVSVVIGLSNDTSTEIISGLSAGDQVVVRTVTGTTQTTTQTPSLLNAVGGARGGGGVGGTGRALGR